MPIEQLLEDEWHPVEVTEDQEDGAPVRTLRSVSAPVVDESNWLVGVITFDDIVDVIEEEAEEDIKALGGVRREEELSDPVWVIARGRFNWLLVNLATAFLASSVLGLFEGELQKMVALAVLAPIVASQGGNAATQTMTVAVRARDARAVECKCRAHHSARGAGRAHQRRRLRGDHRGVAAAAWFKVPGLGLVIGLAMMCNSWPRRSAASWFRSCSTASTPIPRSPRGVRHHGDGRGRVLLVPRHRRAVVRLK